MTFLDFFAGIGGFRRGMELAGHKCVGFCEFDKFANASYRSMHTITDTQREYLATLDIRQRKQGAENTVATERTYVEEHRDKQPAHDG